MEDSKDRRPKSPPIDGMDLSDLLRFLPRHDSNAEQPYATVVDPAVAVSEEGDSHEVASISEFNLRQS
jgi:hypothetical protein